MGKATQGRRNDKSMCGRGGALQTKLSRHGPVGLRHTPAGAGAPACMLGAPPTAAAATAGTGACWQWEPARRTGAGSIEGRVSIIRPGQ